MSARVITGDSIAVLRSLPDGLARTCITSPPYWGLRDYGVDGQIGLEQTPDEFVAKIVDVFREVRRVLANDGTLWLNLGDSYAGSWGSQGRQGKTGLLAGRRACDARRIAASAKFGGATGARGREAGLKPKDLVGIPWMVAFALRGDGWFLRSDIIWHKPNPMPESVMDRPTRAHEYVFLLSKSESYFYDAAAITSPLKPKTLTAYGSTRRSKGTDGLRKVAAANWSRDVPTRAPKLKPDGTPYGSNKRTVWTVATRPFKGAHFATFPTTLVEPCVRAGSAHGDMVLDPFSGMATTGLVAQRLGRDYVGIELNPVYAEASRRRLEDDAPLFARGAA